MHKLSKACGASIGAFNHLNKVAKAAAEGRRLKSAPEMNQQITYIIENLAPRMSTITALKEKNAQQAELSYQTFNIAHHYGQQTMTGGWMKQPNDVYGQSSWA